MDPQGNLAEDFGYTEGEADDQGQSLAAALAFGQPAAPARDVRTNLDVFVGGYHLDAAAAALAAAKDQVGARLALARVLEPIAGDYDLVLIDCPPGIEALQNAAAAAARWALVPARSDASSRKGMLDVARRLDAVVDLNPGLDLLGVVLFGTGTGAHRIKHEARERIVEALGAADVVLTTTIRHSEATAHAARERGQLVHELEEEARKGPSWWQIRRGEASGAGGAPTHRRRRRRGLPRLGRGDRVPHHRRRGPARRGGRRMSEQQAPDRTIRGFGAARSWWGSAPRRQPAPGPQPGLTTASAAARPQWRR